MFCSIQVQTVPSIRWDVVQAGALATPAEHYAGHLPDGSSVQAHSADRFYACYGIVMVGQSNAAGSILWTATRYGRPIISGWSHDAVQNAAAGLLTGA